jgi:soluble lytic murein transglycosylase-like protein
VDGLIDEVARRHSVDPNLVRAMIKVESNFNPRARSRKGAMGLMQLMPSTARELNVYNPYDPAQNLDGGIRHIKSLLEQNGGDVALSLAAYNAGQGAVNRHGGVPRYRETQSYVKRITEMYAGDSPLGGTYRSPIRVTRDSDGHRVYTND